MSLLRPVVIALLLITHCIALNVGTLDNVNIEEQDEHSSSPSRLLIANTEPRRSSHSISLCDDCLVAALEFLDDRADLQSFRGSSKQFNHVYGRHKVRQSLKFRNFRSYYNQSKSLLLDDMLQSIPMISGLYADLDVDSLESDVGTLFDVHLRSRKSMIRGLTAAHNKPFLSLLLWDEMDWDSDPIVLICILIENGLRVSVNIKETRGARTGIVAYDDSNFGVADLELLLQTKRLRISMALGGSVLPHTMWSLERPWYAGHFSSSKELRMFILCVSSLLTFYISLWIFVIQH